MPTRFNISSTSKTLHCLFTGKPQNLRNLSHHFIKSHSLSTTLTPTENPPHLSNQINQISRLLSDFRNPNHDLESSLTSFSTQITPILVEQVLKRCKNLGFSAHRFFFWAKNLPNFEHSIESYHILITILCSSKQFPLIWDFLVEIRDSKLCEIRAEFFKVVFKAYCKADLPGDAIRAFDRMREFGIKPSLDDFDYILFVLCKRKHVKHAHQLFDKFKFEFEMSAKSYSILIRGWGDIGEPNEAHKLFDEMVERGCLIDIGAYNSLLDALCKCGNVDGAYTTFRQMGTKGIEPNACTYSIFIRAFCESNDLHSVFRVLDRTKRYNLVPNVYTYNCIIKNLCKNEKMEEAYQLLDEMIERGVTPDSWSYNAIQSHHCDHNEVNRALKLLSRMEKDMCNPDRQTYNMTLKMLIRIGRFDRVTEVWEGMSEKGFYPSVSTYAVMIHGLCKKKGKLEEACKYFETMIDEGLPPYISTVELLRNRLLGLGLSDQTCVLANKMARSTSCSIQELADAMSGGNGNRVLVRSRYEETSSDSD